MAYKFLKNPLILISILLLSLFVNTDTYGFVRGKVVENTNHSKNEVAVTKTSTLNKKQLKKISQLEKKVKKYNEKAKSNKKGKVLLILGLIFLLIGLIIISFAFRGGLEGFFIFLLGLPFALAGGILLLIHALKK